MIILKIYALNLYTYNLILTTQQTRFFFFYLVNSNSVVLLFYRHMPDEPQQSNLIASVSDIEAREISKKYRYIVLRQISIRFYRVSGVNGAVEIITIFGTGVQRYQSCFQTSIHRTERELSEHRTNMDDRRVALVRPIITAVLLIVFGLCNLQTCVSTNVGYVQYGT